MTEQTEKLTAPLCDTPNCGERATHRIHRWWLSPQDRHLCCRHWVGEGNAPADYHAGCMAAWTKLNPICADLLSVEAMTVKRATTAKELLDSLTASLSDWLGVDGHYYTVAELREAIEQQAPHLFTPVPPADPPEPR